MNANHMMNNVFRLLRSLISWNECFSESSLQNFLGFRRSDSITGWRMLGIGQLVAVVSGVHHCQFGLVMMGRRS